MGTHAMMPTPPPGYTLDAPQDSAAPPTPPPGYTLDQSGQEQGSYLGDVARNVLPDLKNIGIGIGSQIKEGAYDMPKRALDTGLQMASGTPYAETPSGQHDTQFVQNAPAMVSDMAQSYVHPIDSFRERPVSTAMDWASAVIPAYEGAKSILPSSEYLTKSGNQRWFKALGGTLQQAKEIGPDEAQRLGRLARNKNIITPTNSAESQMGNIQQYQDSAGQKIGELRKLGDEMGAAPKFHELLGEIENELGPQYSSGMMSPQQGQFRNAMDELSKTERITKIPQEIPEGNGAYQMTKSEPNPLFTPVPKELTVKNPIAPPLNKPSIFDRSKVPQSYINADNARNAPETIKYKNPMFLSDQPEMRSTENVPRNIFEDYRGDQESGNIIPEYDIKKPGTTDIANKVTQMNKFAKSQNKLLQPSNALTDVANAASSKNDAALVQSLGSEKGLDYVKALGNFSDSEKLMKILENKLAYETGASRNRIVNNLMNRFEQRFGYPVSAEVMDRLSGLKNQKSILGKGAIAATASANSGKVLTKEKAREFLKEANGDKELARQKAREQKYEF